MLRAIECMHYYITQNLPSISFGQINSGSLTRVIFHIMTQLTNAYESRPRSQTSDHVLSLSQTCPPTWLLIQLLPRSG